MTEPVVQSLPPAEDELDEEEGRPVAGAEFFAAFDELPEDGAACVNAGEKDEFDAYLDEQEADAGNAADEAANMDVDDVIGPGSVVRIDGLKSAAHLNGLRGTVVQQDPAGSGRWEVEVVLTGGSTEIKALRPENLSLCADDAFTDAPQAAESFNDDIRPGTSVRIAGLKGAAHLNGLCGTVLQQDPGGSGRWEVEVLVEEGRAPEVKALKAENLVREERSNGVGSDESFAPDVKDEIAVGSTVRISGLKGAAHLNGVCGTVLRQDPGGSGRWEVEVMGEGNVPEVKALKPENLTAERAAKEAVESSSEEIVPGSFVRIDGLKGATHLNGLCGKVLQQDPAGSGRWEVEVVADGKAPEVKALRPENLTVQEAAAEIGPGSTVRITGLKGAAHLNGLYGTVLQLDPSGSGRWEVAVALADGAEPEVKALRPENLVLEEDEDDARSVSEDEDQEEPDVAGGDSNEASSLDDNELAAQTVQAELAGDTERARVLRAEINARKAARTTTSEAAAPLEETIEVPVDFVGRVIGSGGSRIRELSEASGASLQFRPPLEGSSIQILAVRGSPAAVAKAKDLVREIVAGDDAAGGAGGEAGVCKWFAAGFCRNRADAQGACRNGRHDGAAAIAAETSWIAAAGVAPGAARAAGGAQALLLLDLEGGGNAEGRDGEDEIIEVPVLALCGSTGRELGRFHRFVRPGFWTREAASMRKRFHPACFNLSSNAQPFPSVICDLKDWIGKVLGKPAEALVPDDFLFVTCGNWDIKTALPRQSNKPEPGTVDLATQQLLFSKWCNLKDAFRDHYKLPQNVAPTGMRGMLKRLKIRLAGQHHLGMDDVSNLAKILKYMIAEGAVIQPTGHATNLHRAAAKGKGKGSGKGGPPPMPPPPSMPPNSVPLSQMPPPPQMAPPNFTGLGMPPPPTHGQPPMPKAGTIPFKMPPPQMPHPGVQHNVAGMPAKATQASPATPPPPSSRKRPHGTSPGAIPRISVANNGMWGMPARTCPSAPAAPLLGIAKYDSDEEEDEDDEDEEADASTQKPAKTMNSTKKALPNFLRPGDDSAEKETITSGRTPSDAPKLSSLFASLPAPKTSDEKGSGDAGEPPAKVPKLSSLFASLPTPKKT